MSNLDVKQTLKKLHKKFPTMNLDDLFEILDCYVETTSSSLWTTNGSAIIAPYCNGDLCTSTTTGNIM